MNKLKTILFSVYIIIIILLLISLLKCENNSSETKESIQPPKCDTLIQEKDSMPEKIVIKEKFKADVVMCIDCTISMYGIINTIKSNALSFYPDLKQKCFEQGKEIISMRIKVIGFRDFSDTPPFETTTFYEIPEEEDNFRSFISNLTAQGGGDFPERGYDALSMAISSEWKNENDVHQIIILWTDYASHPLSGMHGVATTFENLTSLWNSKMNQSGKRLILFAPADYSWITIEQNWDKTTRHDVNTGGGLSDIDYEEILRTLSENI